MRRRETHWRAARSAGAVVAALALAGGVGGALPGASAARPDDAGPPEERRFIVTLRDSVADPAAVAAEHAGRHDADVHFVYQHALKGYAATFRGGGISDVARDGRVAAVEPDAEVQAFTTQTGATWGLDRIDQRNRPLSTTFTYTNTGSGVTAYVIDTGIRTTHAQFGGRAVHGKDAVDNDTVADDCNGHGTHVAGTIGGATYGVAKGVTLKAVRVLNCAGSGTNMQVIAGIDWVTSDHPAGAPAVANMSLGGGASTALDTAVNNSIADGVSYAVAAGNGFYGLFAQNACNGSPSRVPAAMTISATDQSDKKASWANYGTCVDLFAPGVNITSAWYSSNTATNTISGTSMASPHVAGVAALFLQSNPAASPATVRNALVNNSTPNVVVSPGSGSPNRLLFTSY